jgi:hypothetical protein
MNFLDRLFGKSVWWSKMEEFLPPKIDFVVNPRKFKPVPKWTHAGRKGKTIFCSKCGTPAHVYNFSWWALQCRNCKTMLSKYEWLLPVSRKKRKK